MRGEEKEAVVVNAIWPTFTKDSLRSGARLGNFTVSSVEAGNSASLGFFIVKLEGGITLYVYPNKPPVKGEFINVKKLTEDEKKSLSESGKEEPSEFMQVSNGIEYALEVSKRVVGAHAPEAQRAAPKKNRGIFANLGKSVREAASALANRVSSSQSPMNQAKKPKKGSVSESTDRGTERVVVENSVGSGEADAAHRAASEPSNPANTKVDDSSREEMRTRQEFSDPDTLSDEWVVVEDSGGLGKAAKKADASHWAASEPSNPLNTEVDHSPTEEMQTQQRFSDSDASPSKKPTFKSSELARKPVSFFGNSASKFKQVGEGKKPGNDDPSESKLKR
ncbi:MAG: hypothetical protein COY58_04380 [Gammaproteobacteria bacterium CG_4_10_14_0_8_um_filter_38_16]|nr:MAG: hypothetical protein COY58_04380 [Gammaproteobacteria bacterium CG_4_10_14_0_8_um_filter_38_16]PJA02594.1 MAG: hypothetical protein COX72_09600 [Gammaproteobacteria bacterium CG_4_10_14_0_2_um_filter_38_22]PJB09982.1 MAG: hypothetical protein CO120_07265 [Gammaproteobacteria bacterium CG_4_9_14_3_um_filter_38_9]